VRTDIIDKEFFALTPVMGEEDVYSLSSPPQEERAGERRPTLLNTPLP
jgi:hypothetical protein